MKTVCLAAAAVSAVTGLISECKLYSLEHNQENIVQPVNAAENV